MPASRRTDSSATGSTRVTGSDFYAKRLSPANIEFEELDYPTPEYVAGVIAFLAHWPRSSNTQQPAQASNPEQTELRNATALAQQVPRGRTAALFAQYKYAWMDLLYKVLLDPLVQAASAFPPELSFSRDLSWTEGPSRANLPNPQPDLAFGLALSGDASSPLSKTALQSLNDPSGVQATYSPVARGFSLIYPSFIFEAKSDLGNILIAQNQLAVSAARALAMLNELSSLSRMPFQHCVILAATQGTMWRLHVAYQDLTSPHQIVSTFAVDCTSTLLTPSQHIVPILDPLHVESFPQRERLAYIVNRIKAWMVGPYRAKVCEQLQSMQQFHHQQLQPSDSEEGDSDEEVNA